MYDCFFDDRQLIPADHYTEIAFEDLEHDLVGTVARVVRSSWPGWLHASRAKAKGVRRIAEGLPEEQTPADRRDAAQANLHDMAARPSTNSAILPEDRHHAGTRQTVQSQLHNPVAGSDRKPARLADLHGRPALLDQARHRLGRAHRRALDGLQPARHPPDAGGRRARRPLPAALDYHHRRPDPRRGASGPDRAAWCCDPTRSPRSSSGLFVVSTINGIVGSFFGPALAATIPDLVPTSKVTAANSLGQLNCRATLFVGQALGGVTLPGCSARSSLFFLNGLSFLYSSASEVFVKIPQNNPRTARRTGASSSGTFGREIAEGFRYRLGEAGLREMLYLSASLSLLHRAHPRADALLRRRCAGRYARVVRLPAVRLRGRHDARLRAGGRAAVLRATRGAR